MWTSSGLRPVGSASRSARRGQSDKCSVKPPWTGGLQRKGEANAGAGYFCPEASTSRGDGANQGRRAGTWYLLVVICSLYMQHIHHQMGCSSVDRLIIDCLAFDLLHHPWRAAATGPHTSEPIDSGSMSSFMLLIFIVVFSLRTFTQQHARGRGRTPPGSAPLSSHQTEWMMPSPPKDTSSSSAFVIHPVPLLPPPTAPHPCPPSRVEHRTRRGTFTLVARAGWTQPLNLSVFDPISMASVRSSFPRRYQSMPADDSLVTKRVHGCDLTPVKHRNIQT